MKTDLQKSSPQNEHDLSHSGKPAAQAGLAGIPSGTSAIGVQLISRGYNNPISPDQPGSFATIEHTYLSNPEKEGTRIPLDIRVCQTFNVNTCVSTST